MLQSVIFDEDNVILRVKLLDKSQTDGRGLQALTSSSAGLKISTIASNEATPTVYAQGSSNIESITTLGTFAAPSANKCRFKEVDASNHPGIYEIQIASARFSVANAKSLLVSITGATNLMETDFLIPFDDPDFWADRFLVRDWSATQNAMTVNQRSALNALRFLRNKWSIAAGTLTVCREDDTATAWTSALTTNASADPVTASDPA